ncbi:TrkH family potassium uptake protein [uncultured Ferrovibrio sp.]|jgi:trk system potassium uptake protein TrkH|uniref:TrkH family potassium uptake protein n=1 Tax=uncultured Ferrovibrio sp. TaxID=1576913 RepID=UPI002603918A|nr:TrkH family potassium uptake protein [uncultured Ferrovibrio sp.]
MSTPSQSAAGRGSTGVRLAPILFFVGAVSCCFGIAMLAPMLADLLEGHEDYKVFLICAFGTLFIGAGIAIATYDRNQNINLNETLLLLPATWITVSLVAALPFMISELQLSLADAVFESVSGLTTTGSTVITGLDTLPRGLLLWRFLIQWIGGFGMVTVAVLALPFLRIGGLQLFSLDLSPSSTKFVPRITEVVGQIGIIYTLLTALCALCFWSAGMDGFDAIGHAMTALSTAGFSSHDAGLAYFDSVLIEWIAIMFMVIGAIPFGLYVVAAYGRPDRLLNDDQVRLFFAIILTVAILLTVWRIAEHDRPFWLALHESLFMTVATITTTGFAGYDFTNWGGFAELIALLLMLIGGCTGSTVGGIKVFRILTMMRMLRAQLQRQIFPHGAFRVTFNGENIPDAVRAGVASYIFIYLVLLMLLTLAIALFGLDFRESLGAAATALGNNGPGLGPHSGPCCTFKDVPTGVKWLMAVGMLAGRLEILILLIPFSRSFWRH